MRPILFLFALCVATACHAQEAAPAPDPFQEGQLVPEQVERMQIKQRAMTALLDDDFATLEAMAREYADPAQRTPSGLYKRSLLYAGLDDAFATQGKDDAVAWQQMDARLDAWVKAYPASPTARLARAQSHNSHGWAWRGTCWARCVDEAAWQPFREQVELARKALEADKAIAAVDPHWYQLMVGVATVQEWDAARFDALERETLEHGTGNYDTLFAMAQRYEPKWGGSAEAVEAYVSRLVERTRATEGEGMYARAYWAILGHDAPDDYTIDWTRMQRGIDDVLARYPDPWNLNHFAAIACRAGHTEVAAPLLKRLDPVIPDAWESKAEYERCKADAQ